MDVGGISSFRAPCKVSIRICSRGKRARSPDDFELDTDMTLLYEEEEQDPLEERMKAQPFHLDSEDSLPLFWMRMAKQKSTYGLAQMGLDMAAIPAMSSDCERVFSQGILLITGQRN
jgi:hypothetical protein